MYDEDASYNTKHRKNEHNFKDQSPGQSQLDCINQFVD